MPLVLYCTGDPAWLNQPGTVGMVGSRKPTEYGLQAAEDIGRGLARAGAIVVSGLADGLDSAGHRAAVREDRPTIGVLGVPIDKTYPATNRELRRKIEANGCVISEYPPDAEKRQAGQAAFPPEGSTQLHPDGAVDDLEHGAVPVVPAGDRKI